MAKMVLLLSYMIQKEEALEKFRRWYHDQGNAPGGYCIKTMPRDIAILTEILDREGYGEFRENGEWFKLYEQYQIPISANEIENLIRDYIEKARREKRKYKDIVRGLNFSLHRIFSECTDSIEKKYRIKLIEEATIEELIEYKLQFYVPERLEDFENLHKIVEELKNTRDREGVRKILAREYDYDGAEFRLKFIFGLEEIKILSEISDSKIILKIIKSMGIYWVKKIEDSG
ncbi:hypothetical protein BBF96_03440 [Anoxybacter fermentans]|uniref:Uncharacterized protein n=1 Tax=Anoxybacter fermentans TaxID=1323375 RepID=A0A3S9SW12_9FIRM|nr:hypothetical protein [Anoxybacter fermentans]AZR72517.1 hypothetical protein BBF96_03440 [Anoxybacter fermentans]